MALRLPLLVAIALAGACTAAALGAAAAEPATVTVATPPFGAPIRAAPSNGRVRLDIVSSRAIDPASVTARRPFPAWAPRIRGEDELVVVASQPGTTFLGYSKTGEITRTLVAVGPKHRVKAVFDVTALGRPSVGIWPLELRWAQLVGGVLYVANAHRTYAATTGGRNAYLTAVDAATGDIVWQSPALVANADRFVVVGDVLVTGYGFTREPDFLYALDRRTGTVLSRLALPSAPDLISASGRTLAVRTYDHRVVVRLRAG